MKLKCLVLTGLMVSLVISPSFVAASGEIHELRSKENAAGGEGGAGERIDRLLCIDGLKVYQTVVFGVGKGSGAAVSNIQLYEERDGSVVPARCEGRKKKK